MATKDFSTVPTVATNDQWTAAQHNQYIRDNFDALHEVPSVRVTNSTTQSIPDNTATALTFDTERWDNDDMHSTVSNTSRLTCTRAGKHMIVGQVGFASNTTGLRIARIPINGGTILASVNFDPDGSVTGPSLIVSTIYDLAVNDYVELEVYQNSGGALNSDKSNNLFPEFMMHWIGL